MLTMNTPAQRAALLLLATVLLAQGAAAGTNSAAAPSAAPAGREAWAKPLVREGLPNLHNVTDSLYRGAQPEEGGYAQLKAMGIRTVVSLRAFHSDKDAVEKAGMNYESISFKTWHPEDEDIVRFLQIIGNTNNAPVFVHCQHGADRTGTMCAIHRIFVCGWSKDQAVKEMTDGGFGFHPIWDNLVTYIRDLDVDAIRRKLTPAASPAPLTHSGSATK